MPRPIGTVPAVRGEVDFNIGERNVDILIDGEVASTMDCLDFRAMFARAKKRLAEYDSRTTAQVLSIKGGRDHAASP